jgi:hypothetical protein
VKHAIFDLVALALLLAGLARFEARGDRVPRALRIGWIAGFGALALFQALTLLRIVFANIAQPPLWDFKVFWMVGRVAVSGGDVYDPASYAPFAAGLNPGRDPLFAAVALGVGLPYPPPVLALFVPLGRLDLVAALRLWYVAMLVALALAALLLWRQFFARDGATGALTAALLLLLLPQTGATFALAQINVFALCLLLAYWRETVAWRAGLWLAPLGLMRPPAFALALEHIAPGRRAFFAGLAAALALLFVAAVPLAGPRAMATYARANPSSRYPESFFVGYQSLYELFARSDAGRGGFFSLTAHPAYLLCAALLLAGAAALALRAAPESGGMLRGALLALGLFIYPSTGPHYALLLLAPLGELWLRREELGVGTIGAIAAIELNYGLLRVGDASATIGLLLCLDAAFFAALALRAPRPDRRDIALRGALTPRYRAGIADAARRNR